jgi:aquaporin Z
MSRSPARSFGPALVGQIWNALWIYFTAPPIGMLLAAELFVRVRGTAAVTCAKLHHQKRETLPVLPSSKQVRTGGRGGQRQPL